MTMNGSTAPPRRESLPDMAILATG
jgi:hypothetical protein